jgi:hypothetical protein
MKMDPDLNLKRRQTITNIVDYPINSENNHHGNLNSHNFHYRELLYLMVNFWNKISHHFWRHHG